MWRVCRFLVIAAVLIGAGWYVLVRFAGNLPEDATDDEKLKSLLFSMLGIVFVAGGMAALLWPFAGVIGSYFEGLFWAKGGAAAAPPMY
ncbi:MAG: hypothetical protein LBD30_01875, partial [Verrucomicrobiales bacterium]|nr:hypothetical protein [Verrucomicrobiales bacterium]